jgi:PAS domain S-box-containing protein
MTKADKKAVTILLIDDNPANLFSLQNLLEKNDRSFLTAMSGSEGLKLALNKPVDLIILDVEMPDINGFEVAQILKSNRKTKEIPIIFASGHQKEPKSMLKGFEEGAIDYLVKPLDPELTKAKVEVLLKIHLQKKELIEKNHSLEKAALLINNSSDIIGIIDKRTLKFEEVNVAFTSILGYPLEEAKETPLTFFLPAHEKELLESKIREEKEKLSFETRIYCKNRSLKWLGWVVTVQNNKWFINARDITEVKEVERIKNYVAAIAKQSSDAIYIHNEEGRIISWNEGAERIYGYTEEEALNMKIWNIIPDYIQPETQEMVNKLMDGDKVLFLETKRITKRGQIVDVLFSASIIIDPTDQHKSVAITERDVTKQKIDEERILQLNSDLQKNVAQLEEANNELESFSYSVSHDLRAPLRAIHTRAKLLEENAKLEGQSKEALLRIQYNAEKMGRLIDDLLAFSAAGKTQILKSQTDMEVSVKESIAELSESIKHHAIFKIGSLPPAVVDRNLMNQVWINLISNAIKYSGKKENPKIEIGSETKDNFLVYYIKDNGVGFNMNHAHKLFDTFQRLHSSNEFQGTGIGLAIVNRIITRHNGTVWGEGMPDKGATFYFTIPIER